MKNVIEKTKSIKQKVAKKIIMFQVTVMSILVPMQVSATNKLTETGAYKGFMNLINDATNVLIISSVAITVFLAAFQLAKYRMAEEQEKSKYKKNVINVLVVGVAIVLVESLVKVIFSYFVAG